MNGKKRVALLLVAALVLPVCAEMCGAQKGALVGAGTGAAPPPPRSQASVTVPGQYAADPTRGQFVSRTPYQLKVYVDVDPARESSEPYLTMNPNDVLPASLDVGQHRLVAIASRDTQMGPRPVGRYDQQLRVDVRGSGWQLRFTDGDLR